MSLLNFQNTYLYAFDIVIYSVEVSIIAKTSLHFVSDCTNDIHSIYNLLRAVYRFYA